MELIDDKISVPDLFFTPTRIEDSPSYSLDDNLELTPSLNFDNPGNVPTCLIHCISMIFNFDSFHPHWKCPLCEPKTGI